MTDILIGDRIYAILLDYVKDEVPAPMREKGIAPAHITRAAEQTREGYLSYLRANPGALTTDVAQACGVTRHSAACRLGALEKDGVVVKRGTQGQACRWWARG